MFFMMKFLCFAELPAVIEFAELRFGGRIKAF